MSALSPSSCLSTLSWRRLGATLSLLSIPLLAHAGGTNVGVSVSVNQPGFYGRVDIGNAPPPLIYEQPIIIQQPAVQVVRRPIYLRVPPGHERRWAQYCGRYQACGQPVYFVRPEARWEARDNRWEDRHEDHHDDRGGDRRHGHGHGHGKGHRD